MRSRILAALRRAFWGVLDTTNTGTSVWADSAYRSSANEAFMERHGFRSQVHHRSRLKPTTFSRQESGRVGRCRCLLALPLTTSARQPRHRQPAKLSERALSEPDGLAIYARRALEILVRRLVELTGEIDALDRELGAWHASNEASQRLAAVPGIGVITATAIAVGRFRLLVVGDCGRDHGIGDRVKQARRCASSSPRQRSAFIACSQPEK
jgi:hypothetical protein